MLESTVLVDQNKPNFTPSLDLQKLSQEHCISYIMNWMIKKKKASSFSEWRIRNPLYIA
jgi:hypothetical protein